MLRDIEVFGIFIEFRCGCDGFRVVKSDEI